MVCGGVQEVECTSLVPSLSAPQIFFEKSRGKVWTETSR